MCTAGFCVLESGLEYCSDFRGPALGRRSRPCLHPKAGKKVCLAVCQFGLVGP